MMEFRLSRSTRDGEYDILHIYFFHLHERSTREQEELLRNWLSHEDVRTIHIFGAAEDESMEVTAGFFLGNRLSAIQRSLGVLFRQVRLSERRAARFVVEPEMMRIIINCYENHAMWSG